MFRRRPGLAKRSKPPLFIPPLTPIQGFGTLYLPESALYQNSFAMAGGGSSIDYCRGLAAPPTRSHGFIQWQVRPGLEPATLPLGR